MFKSVLVSCAFLYFFTCMNVFANNLDNKKKNSSIIRKYNKSVIESITFENGHYFITYSRDNSTGFCWVNTQSDLDLIYNTTDTAPMYLMGTGRPDLNCNLFKEVIGKTAG